MLPVAAFLLCRSSGPARSPRKVHASDLTPLSRAALTAALLADDDASVDVKCKRDLQRLIAVDWEPWGNTVVQAGIEVPALADYDGFLRGFDAWTVEDNCARMDSAHPVRKAQLRFLESCGSVRKAVAAKSDGSQKISANVQVCYRQLAGYQLALIDHLANRLPLELQSDAGILHARYLAETERPEPNPQHLFRLMQQLVAADPHNRRLLRFAIDSAFSAWLASSGDEARQNAVLAKTTLEKFAAEAPEDTDLPALTLAERRLAKDFDGVRRLSTEVGEKDPEAAAYYRAWAAYDEKKFELAEKTLSDFLDTKPAHARYFEVALEQVRSRGSDQLAFSDRFIAIRRLGDRLGLDE